MDKNDYHPFVLLIFFLIVCVVTGINPADRISWILEFLMVFGAVLILTLTYNKFRFSNTAYTLMFIFLILPVIGGYFNFESVPVQNILSFFQEGRNNFDRLVHFTFGLVFGFVVYEFVKRKTKLKGWWLYVIPIMFVFAISGFYEVVEWWATLVFSHETAFEFLGTQGDLWDPQKDIMMGGIGSIISISYIYFKEKVNLKK